MSGAPEYRYQFDAEYLRVAEARAAGLLPGWRRVLVSHGLFIVLGGALCAWYFVWLWEEPLKLVVALAVTITVYAYEVKKGRRNQRHGGRGTPLENASVRVVFAPDGFDVEAPSSRSHDPWSVVSRARAFEDGLLLFEPQGTYRWLPHASLTSASPSEAEEWVRTRVPDFARAP